MRPPSYDEFIQKEKDEVEEPFGMERCPTPGCGSGQINVHRGEDGLITDFKCAKGCVFTAHRNAFTGEITYYSLDEFDFTKFPTPEDVRSMKFTPLGEPHTDWY